MPGLERDRSSIMGSVHERGSDALVQAQREFGDPTKSAIACTHMLPGLRFQFQPADFRQINHYLSCARSNSA